MMVQKNLPMRLEKLQSEFSNQNIEYNQMNFGLTINSVGFKSILPNKSIARANKFIDYQNLYKKGSFSDEFKLIYIIKGTGFIHFENHEEIEISQGKILIIMPHQKYEYYHIYETEWKEYFIRFEADTIYLELIKTIFEKQNQIVTVGFNEEILRLFHRTRDVIRNELTSSQVYLSGMLLCLVGIINAELKNSAAEKKEIQAIDKAKLIMNENVMNKISLHEISLELNIGYSTFRKNFKKYVGLSPAKYFNELRLNKAKQLLIESTLSIKEIAYMLNFSTIEHFATTFKKNNGYTPKDFRVKTEKIKIVPQKYV